MSFARADDLASALAKRSADSRIRGAAIGIVSAGQSTPVVLEGDVATPTAEFEIGTATKAFTGLAAAELSLQGKLDLEAPVSGLVPELAGTYAGTVTAHELATNTAKLPADLSKTGYTEADLLAYLKTAPATPGQGSDLSFALLGVVIGRAAQAAFGDFVQSSILNTLDMHATGFLAGPPAPAGLLQGYDVILSQLPFTPVTGPAAAVNGVYSNANDLLLFVKLNLTPESFGDLGRAAALSQKLGLGWDAETAPYTLTGGSFDGFSASLSIDPARKSAALAMLNALDLYEAQALRDIALGGPDNSADPTFPAGAVTALAGAYYGTSSGQSAELAIQALGTQYLTLTLGSANARLYPVSPSGKSGSYAFVNYGATFTDFVTLPGAPATLTGTVPSLTYNFYVGTDSSGQPKFSPLAFQRQTQ